MPLALRSYWGNSPTIEEDWARIQFVWGLHGEIADDGGYSSPNNIGQCHRDCRASGDGQECCQTGVTPKQQSKDVKRRQSTARELQDDDGGFRNSKNCSCSVQEVQRIWALGISMSFFSSSAWMSWWTPRTEKRQQRKACGEEQPVANAALAQSEPEVSWGVLQPTPSIPAVSLGGLQGN